MTCASLVILCAAHCSGAGARGSSSTSQAVTGTAGDVTPFANPGLCLDVVDQSTANGAGVQVWSCTGNANQQWLYDGTNLRVYGDKCLDVTGGSTANGTKLQIWDCVASDANQTWTRVGSTFVWMNHDMCVDLTNGAAADGTLIQVWTCTAGNTNQEWSYDGIGGSSSSGGGSSGGSSGGVDASSPPGSPAAYVTTDNLSQALAPTPVTLGAGGAAGVTVTIDPTTKYQTIVGFGASITDSSSYVMTQYLSQSAFAALLVKLFDPQQGVGLSFLRQPMGASDFSSVGNFSYDDGSADPTLARFDIAQDLKATVPVLKQALAIQPGLFVLATPWSPPAWMKLNDSMDGSGGAGGNPGLVGGDYEAFAQYFVKFVQAYAQQGVTVRAVTPQNEPLNGSAAYPGMGLTEPYELQLIAQNMGPAFQSAGIATQIWAYDHNWDTESYPAGIVADPTAGPFTEGAAFHCYGGDPSAMTTFHDAFPQKSVYMTECSGGTWQSDPFANTIDLAIDSTNNWARAVALWNMALDQNAGPQNDGCSTCRGVVTVNSQSGDVTYNVDYYALGHFAKFVRPGATRIASTSSSGSLNQVAFSNPDGTLAFVAHNTGSASTTVRVGSGASAMSVTVPANAAVTLVWSSTP